ncbi:IS630 family transposase domain protein [Rickettsiales endosymbiont of Paramecium tredecaurelia]|nr:IS630 family transposase domain protein [Candidatus Sarmatiella mevalonica]
MTYSIDFRKKVLEVKEKEGLSFSEVALRFGISRAAVFRWSNKRDRPWKKLDKEALDLFRNSLMMSKCEEYTKHRAAAYMKYVRTCASTASPQLPSGVELGKRSTA